MKKKKEKPEEVKEITKVEVEVNPAGEEIIKETADIHLTEKSGEIIDTNKSEELKQPKRGRPKGSFNSQTKNKKEEDERTKNVQNILNIPEMFSSMILDTYIRLVLRSDKLATPTEKTGFNSAVNNYLKRFTHTMDSDLINLIVAVVFISLPRIDLTKFKKKKENNGNKEEQKQAG